MQYLTVSVHVIGLCRHGLDLDLFGWDWVGKEK